MKFFKIPEINDVFCIIIELVFRKTCEPLIQEDSYKCRLQVKVPVPFLGGSLIW